ncbi:MULTISPECIES: hypothetical protein [Bacteroidales]|uniref:hypothetical protein n=1 Tax=Bacteroidales TaxID=171549 RepID=UPI001440F3A5|nr:MULTISPECIES: hypothetical protein [Bacteroidales]
MTSTSTAWATAANAFPREPQSAIASSKAVIPTTTWTIGKMSFKVIPTSGYTLFG